VTLQEVGGDQILRFGVWDLGFGVSCGGLALRGVGLAAPPPLPRLNLSLSLPASLPPFPSRSLFSLSLSLSHTRSPSLGCECSIDRLFTSWHARSAVQIRHIWGEFVNFVVQIRQQWGKSVNTLGYTSINCGAEEAPPTPCLECACSIEGLISDSCHRKRGG